MRAPKHVVSKTLVVMLTLLCAALVSGPLWASTAPDVPSSISKAQAVEGYGRLPLFFIENQGQVDSQVKFFTRGQGHAIFFTPQGMVLSLNRASGEAKRKGADKRKGDQAVVQLRPQGIRANVEILAAEPLAGKVNYFQGNDPSQWRTEVPTFKSVLYREAYPGIDLKFYGAGQQVEYDLVVKPGADPSQVKFLYQGIKSLQVTKEGDLNVVLPGGDKLVQKRPVIYQEINGQRVSREGKFRLLPGTGNRGYGFQLAAYDTRYPLIIDPVNLIYSTYLGGTVWESGNGITVDAAGNAYVVGTTQSTNFPVVLPAQATFGGAPEDAFITKFNPAGSALVYSTYLGGNNDDIGMAIAVDALGNAYVTGETASNNFPLSATPFQNTLGGFFNAFYTRLDAAGALSYSTYLGGTNNGGGPGTGSDMGKAIAVDAAGNAYVAGDTSSINFPFVLGFQATLNGPTNGFITKFAPAGTVVYSTYLGGSVFEAMWGIAVDTAGSAYVAGETQSPNFPVTNLSTLTGFTNAFVTKMNPAGSAPVYSTYYGGTGNDMATGGIAVDASGNAYIAGNTDSTDFPTLTPFQATLKGFNNAFAVKFNAAGTAVYSTYLGGSGTDIAWFIALDALGNAYITGETDSLDFPLFNGHYYNLSPALPGASSAFVTSLNTFGTGLRYSTFLGGTGQDFGFGIAVDASQQAYVTGLSLSTDFPLVNAFQATPGSLGSAFVAKLRLMSLGGPIEPLLLN